MTLNKTFAFRNWKAALLLGAGLLLFAACTVEEPSNNGPENDGVSTPSDIQSPAPERDGPTLTPPPGDTPEPGETPAVGERTDTTTPEPSDGTPEVPVSRRPIPNNGGDSTVQRIPDTPVPEPTVLLPNNTLALVMAVSGGSSSSTLKTIVNDSTSGAMLGTEFIQLESSSKSVVLYLPDTGESTVIVSYSSPSYAPNFKRPYTVGDHLYISGKFTNGGAMTITEYDTEDLSRDAEWGTQEDALNPGYAVAGGQVYFNTGSTQQWSMSRGFYNAPGDYVSSPFNSRWETSEMDKPELRFDLISGGDTLYGATLPTEENPITGVFTVDPVTGQPADSYITAFEIEDWDTYRPASWRNVVISDDIAYWAGFVEGSGTNSVEILAASLTDPDVFTIYEFDMPASDNQIIGFNSTIDADGGYVLLKPFYQGGDRSLVIFDTVTETVQVIDTGFVVVDAQLLYIEG
jgi:hypothetical protein